MLASLVVKRLEFEEQQIRLALESRFKHQAIDDVVHEELEACADHNAGRGGRGLGLDVGDHAEGFVFPCIAGLLLDFIGEERNGHDAPLLAPVLSVDGERHVLSVSREDDEDDVASAGAEFHTLGVEDVPGDLGREDDDEVALASGGTRLRISSTSRLSSGVIEIAKHEVT